MAGTELPPVVISAGGESSRLRDFISEELGLPHDFPKHLLPTGGPNGETLLGRIVRQSNVEPLPVPIINVPEAGIPYIAEHPDVGEVEYDTERFGFSLDPLYYRVRRTGATALGCAGDFYSDFNWKNLLEEHQTSGAAMSLLVNKTPSRVEAATFDIDPLTNRITGIHRERSAANYIYTNIGAYILDPDDGILDVLDRFLPADTRDSPTDDTIFAEILKRELAGAIVVEGHHFNVNTPEEYAALRQYTENL